MLNAKLRYAIIALVDIALQSPAHNVRALDIAKRQNISQKILESILPQLKKEGFLKAVIGPGGGYKLQKPPENIFLSQIVDAMGEKLKVARCEGPQYEGCLITKEKCKTHDLWNLLERKFYGALESVSLSDIITNNLHPDFRLVSLEKENLSNNISNNMDCSLLNITVNKTLQELQDSVFNTTNSAGSDRITNKAHPFYNKETIYLDHNSTTNMLDYALEKYQEALKRPYNPASTHYHGQIAKKIIEEARYNIKNKLHAGNNYNLIFTSSGTESNNLAFHSFPTKQHIISAIEHLSVMNSAINPIIIRVNKEGLIDLKHLEETLEENSLEKGGKTKNSEILVSIMLANNETGVLQNLAAVTEIVHKYKGLLHTDAAQALGKIPVNIDSLNADLITISSHKIGGGFGAGALIYKKNLSLKALLKGGGQEWGLRSGTLNTPAIAAFSAATSFIEESIINMERVKLLKDYLEEQLKARIPSIIICSQGVDRLPNTSCIITPGLLNSIQLMHFDLNNICVSSGSACSSGKIEPSYVLLNMGYEETLVNCAIRISLGNNTNKKSINDLVESWVILYNGT